MVTTEAVADLVARLTLDEKVAQLGGLSLPGLVVFDPRTGPGLDTGRVAELCPHGVGHLSLAWFLGRDADSLRDALARVQEAVREASPFGIGGLVHFEGINGFLHAAGEQFPTAWAQAATWEPELVRRASAVTAAHMRDLGVQLLFAPVMDLARDPRWGRTHETYGEDPELAARFAVAFVRGVHGDRAGGDAEDAELLATGKHFLGFGASEGGLNMATTQLGRRTLTDEYAEPFRRAIAEAGLSVVMNSYNEIDGIPAAANHWLLTDLLRGELGFTGMVVGDYESVDMLRTRYRTAASPGAAAAQAIAAGLDAELPQARNVPGLVDEVASGRLDERVVDEAVARVLTIKARTGLIPRFRTAPPARPAPPDRAEAAEIRRAVADRALVLLSNDGTLPLTAGGGRIVVVGPAADDLRVHFGAYTSVAAAEMPAAIQAIRRGEVPGADPAAFDATAVTTTPLPGLQPRFEEMARALHPGARTVLGALRDVDPTTAYVPLGSFAHGSGPRLGAAAVDAAVAGADVVVAVVGERTGRVGGNTAGEGRSSVSPTLPGDQDELLRLLGATGKPVVTVVVSGRPLLLARAARASAAMLLAPLLGEAAGTAIASAVFGRTNPSGKLPGTFPRHLGQIPAYHGHRHGSGYDHPTGDTSAYVDLDDPSPLFAFGHGLAYTGFDVALTGTPRVRDGVLTAAVTVTNTGAVDGETVVQLYARHEFARVVRPVRQLLQFRRVAVPAGRSREIVLEAPVERLCHTLPDGRRGLDPGDVTLLAGLSSDDIRDTAIVRVPGR
ncbi:glycoside hydrolase family 3 C-terminal domain-containing protein [Yinghuangia sp. ASG 101]|uniref:glycoside hydrolase family 3 N-terminal domain-containing protein n=1 Tax=Yinghuangia sp. ASG 101 TaxID=2896848 RepID=UPI001E5F996A|nr:glycoside hydrolase family 3 N-terminal domain-containing protein [Yinghuangia sp. ASG 101]UGQ11588.1 glycoside hydrolase family 3 C-terminal domain-containing protein [Yinghuangia sp. ASG 101]